MLEDTNTILGCKPHLDPGDLGASRGKNKASHQQSEPLSGVSPGPGPGSDTF